MITFTQCVRGRWRAPTFLVGAFALFALLIAVNACFIHENTVTRPKEMANAGIPGLMIDHLSKNLGHVGCGEMRKCSFLLANRGKQPLSLTSLLTDCSCIGHNFKPTRLDPGQSVELELLVHAPSEPEVFHHRASLQVAMPAGAGGRARAIPLAISGSTELPWSLTIFPKTLDFGEAKRGSILKREIFVEGDAALVAEIPKVIDIYATGGGGQPERADITLQPSDSPTTSDVHDTAARTCEIAFHIPLISHGDGTHAEGAIVVHDPHGNFVKISATARLARG